MSITSRIRLVVPGVLLGALLAPASGCFLLERADQLAPGTVVGRVVDVDGAPAANAAVVVAGVQRRARADDDGRFRITGLPAGGHALTALLDVDADGVADQGALVVLGLGERSGQPVGVALGTITLRPTGVLTGRSVDDGAAAIGAASLAVWRTAELPVGGGAPQPVELAAEQVVQSSPDGRFTIRGLIAGPVNLAGFDAIGDVATRASGRLEVEVPAGDTRDVGDVALLPVAGTRRVELAFNARQGAPIELRLAPVGTLPPEEPTVSAEGGVDIVSLDVPVGLWDVYARSGSFAAVLLGQVAPAPPPDVVAWGVATFTDLGVVCGDGVISEGELCDDGDANSDTVVGACRSNCLPARCGDGVVDTGEACDDGAANSDTVADACRTTCVEPACGDSVVDDGEACDDGAANSDTAADACRTDCALPVCGDGVVDGDEACDNGDAPAVPCTPTDVSCVFCADGCVEETVAAEVDVVVDVVSVQGYRRLPLAGVDVRVGAVAGVSDDAGRVTLRVPLPLPTHVEVGDHVDAAPFATRAFMAARAALPGDARHDDTVARRVEVLEGCAAAFASPALSLDTGDFFHPCVGLQQGFRAFAEDGALVAEDGSPLTGGFTLRVATPERSLFDDAGSVLGFPAPRTADGTALSCFDLFTLAFDGAALNAADPFGFRVQLSAPPGERPGATPWVFDAASDAFVEVPGALVDDVIRPDREGTWCFGAPAVDTGCATLTVVDARPGTVALDIVGTDGALSRRSITAEVGAPVCVPLPVGSYQVLGRADDGRQWSSSIFLELEGSCADGATCTAIDVLRDPVESDGEGCVFVDGSVTAPDFSDLGPPAGEVLFGEVREGTHYRGRLVLFAERRRCLTLPRASTRVEWRFPGITDACANPFATATIVNSAAPKFLPDETCPVEPATGTCDADLGFLDFFCGS